VKPLLQALPGRYYSRAWLVDGYRDRDWSAVLWRDRGGEFCASLRLRLITDGIEQDNVYECPGLTEAQAIAKINEVAARVIKDGIGTELYKMPVRSMQPAWLQAMFNLRFPGRHYGVA
jgi:hypothetical protein